MNWLALSPNGTYIAGSDSVARSSLLMYWVGGYATTFSQTAAPQPLRGTAIGWINDTHLVFFDWTTSRKSVLTSSSGAISPDSGSQSP
jgi:hypothetical protein